MRPHESGNFLYTSTPPTCRTRAAAHRVRPVRAGRPNGSTPVAREPDRTRRRRPHGPSVLKGTTTPSSSVRNAGRSNHDEPDRRAFNLGCDSPQVLGRCTDLTAAEIDFDSEPCAVVPLDDDVDLIPALGVPVVEDSAGLSGLGVNTDVMHDLSLEEESQGLRICEQPVGSGAQKAGRERGVGEAARRGPGGRLLGPQARGPCGLVLNEEHPPGQVMKGGNGGRTNSRRELLLHPASESREGGGLRLECGHSPQVGEKAARVAQGTERSSRSSDAAFRRAASVFPVARPLDDDSLSLLVRVRTVRARRLRSRVAAGPRTDLGAEVNRSRQRAGG